MPSSTRYYSLDIWRGVACLFIVLLHSAGYTHNETNWLIKIWDQLWIGVPMFFVISGYCISATADATRRNVRHPAWNYFYRRFRRIYPPYWCFLLLALIATTLAPSLFNDPLYAIPQVVPMNLGRWI